MNLVERWFGHLDNKAIRPGVFLSVGQYTSTRFIFGTVLRTRGLGKTRFATALRIPGAADSDRARRICGCADHFLYLL